MDSKILCMSLLLAGFCLWSIEAGIVEDSKYEGEKHEYDSDDTRAAINEHTTKVAGITAKKYANKAKTKEAESRLYAQCSKDRFYYGREYARLAEKSKQTAAELHQIANADRARVGRHLAAQREWNSKAREANTQCKQEEAKCQELQTKSREARRERVLALIETVLHEAIHSAYSMKAERAEDMSKEMKRIAGSISNYAQGHYMKGKEDKNRASTDRVKAHQQAEDSQRHHAACRAYQQEALKTRLASRANIMKYIQNSLLAERHQCLSSQAQLKSDMSNKVAADNAKMSEDTAAMEKNLYGQRNLYLEKARHAGIRGYEFGESRKMMGTEMADTGEFLHMAQAKDENPDEEQQYHPKNYYADDPVKVMPSEDKDPVSGSEEGFL